MDSIYVTYEENKENSALIVVTGKIAESSKIKTVIEFIKLSLEKDNLI